MRDYLLGYTPFVAFSMQTSSQKLVIRRNMHAGIMNILSLVYGGRGAQLHRGVKEQQQCKSPPVTASQQMQPVSSPQFQHK
eukprot:scaffold239642_cov22-Tisochrysis_lutea.AAC.1